MKGGYTLYDYGTMVDGANRRRAESFTDALRRHITSESVVLDLGTGAGYFAMIAAKLGAKCVYGIETNPAVNMAKRLAEDNGLAERITFFHADATKVDLPRKADIILGDLGGALPLAGPNIPVFMDAQARHLAPGGIMLPAKARLLAAVVSKPGQYRRMTRPWEAPPLELNFQRARAEAVNSPRKMSCRSDELLTDSASWLEFDYATVDTPHATGQVALTAVRPGTAHGIVLWLEYDFGDQHLFSAAPASDFQDIYTQLFLPLPQPVELFPGDRVDVSLRARQRKNDFHYVWSWNTRIQDAKRREKADFQQASLPTLTT